MFCLCQPREKATLWSVNWSTDAKIVMQMVERSAKISKLETYTQSGYVIGGYRTVK
ncbi:hypothetical protein PR001_g2752 [Phytophthora rubi]|uniref:Uncharacterized protein n=1 Tax=Phytophthora rubi TaxID=129364 RepID=A0A6A3P2U3_9STRA|nr:hypothetical protein PR002_g1040 [Phytophthora rubi]KAE9050048.1 hypothetical protein PR001_g2752 [Phytophthora rubi]